MKSTIYGIILFVGICIGIGVGHKLFNKPEQPAPPSVKLADKSQEKKSSTIIKYLPSNCVPPEPGQPMVQEIASIETFDTETKNDIKSDSVMVLPDNYVLDTDFKSEIGFRYRFFDKLPAFVGPEYNFQHSELKIKGTWTGRINL